MRSEPDQHGGGEPVPAPEPDPADGDLSCREAMDADTVRLRVDPAVPNQRELRLALAMKGGVSLAVWIGGAVSEINRLRVVNSVHQMIGTSTEVIDPDAHPWRRLARLVGYSSVSIDVVTGTSAGGLNGTVLAGSLVYGYPFERMRELWIQLGDIEALTRDTPLRWGEPPPPSLLDGDDYFLARLREILTGFAAEPPRQPAVDRLDLLLTATLREPIAETRFDDRQGVIHESRRKGSFRFRHYGQPGDPLSDFDTGDESAFTCARLALAGRSTSSFPFAFEPGTVYSADPPVSGQLDMSRVFSEITTGTTPFRIVDGGVLDNIPVSAAIKAIAASPAGAPTDRWLLYLQPDPVERPATGGASVFGGHGRALNTGLSALLTRYSQESLLEDIDELERHNTHVHLGRMRMRAAFAPLLEIDGRGVIDRLDRLAWTVRRPHASIRAQWDAENLVRKLTGRDRVVGPASLPRRPTDPLSGWDPETRSALPTRLTEALRAAAVADPAETFADVVALGSAINFCIDWARELERRAPNAEVASAIAGAKAALYLLRFTHELLNEFADRQLIRAATDAPPDDLDTWVDTAVTRRRCAVRSLPATTQSAVSAVLDAMNPVDTGVDRGFQSALARLAETLLALEDALSEDGPVDPVTQTWQALFRVADGLAAAVSTVQPPVIDTEGLPELIGYDLLTSCRQEERGRILTDLLVLSAPIPGGPGDHIRFLRIASDTDSPIPFTALRDGTEPLRAGAKLCGLDLAGFAAFFSARWRANDWMWGRLDAAANLVALLLDARRLRAVHADPEAVITELRSVATSSPRAELTRVAPSVVAAWDRFLTQRWASRAEVVAEEIHALYAHPDREHPLWACVDAITERLQWGILAEELPFVRAVNVGSHTGHVQQSPAPTPEMLSQVVDRYDVGGQNLRDLSEHRIGRIATRLAFVGYRTIQPGSSTWWRVVSRAALAVVKPWLILTTLILAAPRRTVLAFGVGLAGALPGVWAPRENWSLVPLIGDVQGTVWDVPRWILSILAVGLGIIAITQAVIGYRRRRAGVLEPVATVLWLIVGFVMTALDVRLGAIPVALCAIGALWLASFWTRPRARLAVTAVGGVGGYLATAVLFAGLEWTVGWWTAVAPVVMLYVVTGLASVFPVFAPQPREGGSDIDPPNDGETRP